MCYDQVDSTIQLFIFITVLLDPGHMCMYIPLVSSSSAFVGASNYVAFALSCCTRHAIMIIIDRSIQPDGNSLCQTYRKSASHLFKLWLTFHIPFVAGQFLYLCQW